MKVQKCQIPNGENKVFVIIGLDKSEYQVNGFLITRQKHIVVSTH